MSIELITLLLFGALLLFSGSWDFPSFVLGGVGVVGWYFSAGVQGSFRIRRPGLMGAHGKIYPPGHSPFVFNGP